MVNVDSWGGPNNNIAGPYVGGQTTTIRPSETQTGGLFVKTTTIQNGKPTSTGVSFNPSLTSILSVFGVENNTGVNIGASIGGTTSSNGVSLNGGVNLQLWELSGSIRGNLGANTKDWVHADLTGQVGWENQAWGGGAHLPTNPWESARLFGYYQERDGNTTIRNEAGVHVEMGAAYVLIASLKFAPAILPLFLDYLTRQPVFAAAPFGFDNECQGGND